MTEWADVAFEDSYTVEEIFCMNGGEFPFWVRPYRTRYAILKVTDRMNGRWQATRYDAFTGRVLGEGMVREDGRKGWLPINNDELAVVFHI